jgi:ATP-citrate lyase beta-subunit
MARVKLSEYKAKQLLLGGSYAGVQLRSGDIHVPEGTWVAKVDQGVKKRFKQGLVVVDKVETDIALAIADWEKKGFSQFILEPYFNHEASEEQYVSLERTREGIRILHARDGGVDIETHPEAVQVYTVRHSDEIAAIVQKSGLPEKFLQNALRAFDAYYFAFMEINPLVVRGDDFYLLDAAVLVDSAGEFFVRDSWSEADIVKQKAKHEAETRVEMLAATTPASLKLSVINPDGPLFFLLSGGGGSIVIADEVQLHGAGSLLANYGEYSGGPTREETYLYTKEILALLLSSCAPRKALVIAGGVANFTDVKKTFLGIIDALTEVAPQLRMQSVRVFVRRGGPNEAAGLARMSEFLKKEDLFGSVHGSNDIITTAAVEAIAFVKGEKNYDES